MYRSPWTIKKGPRLREGPLQFPYSQEGQPICLKTALSKSVKF